MNVAVFVSLFFKWVMEFYLYVVEFCVFGYFFEIELKYGRWGRDFVIFGVFDFERF